MGEQPLEPVVLQWDDFQALFATRHKQGEHLAAVGPNGSGKTLLCLECCKIIGARTDSSGRPSSVVVLQYKPRDDTLRQVLPENDWKVIKKWPPGFGSEHAIVWPRGGPPSTAAKRQRAVFMPLMDTIYQEGGQTVYVPEAAYFERPIPNGLGMGGTMEQYWSTARSLKITMISDTQRPRQVTRLMWSEPVWLFIFALSDWEDIKRVGELSEFKREVMTIVPKLGPHEFLAVQRERRKGGQKALYVSRVDA